MGILDDYFALQRSSMDKYGRRTVVLCEIGSFYEIYEYDPDEDKTTPVAAKGPHMGWAREISHILHMTLTSEDKSKPHTVDNPFLVGFPVPAFEKSDGGGHRKSLLEANFTLVMMTQTKTGKVITREVSQVISPGTNIEEANISNNLICVYLECQKTPPKLDNWVVIAGISSLDIVTGKNSVGEVYSRDNDPLTPIHEVYRYLLSACPREVLIFVQGCPESRQDAYVKYLNEQLELNRYMNVFVRMNKVEPDYLKSSYHVQFLNKVFLPNGQMVASPTRLKMSITSPRLLEELNLERCYYGCVSWVLLLQHCYEHNQLLIHKLAKPEVTTLTSSSHLILTHNALTQLNLVPASNSSGWSKDVRNTLDGSNGSGQGAVYDSLLSVLNNAATGMGRRLLRQRLLNPTTSMVDLEAEYDRCDELAANVDLMTALDKGLSKLPDLERFHRKISMATIRPHELAQLFKSYRDIIDIYSLLDGQTGSLSQLFLTQEDIDSFNSCLHMVWSSVNVDVLAGCVLAENRLDLPANTPFVLEGVDSVTDELLVAVTAAEARLAAICDHLNTFVPTTKGRKAFEFSVKKARGQDEENSSRLVTTAARAKTLKANLANIDATLCGSLEFKMSTNQAVISSSVMDELCGQLDACRVNLEKRAFEVYHMYVAELDKYTFYGPLVEFIAGLDVALTNAKNSRKYRYYRPTLVDNTNGSFVHIHGLRHPIIERLISTEYVTNDVFLGHNKGHNQGHSQGKDDVKHTSAGSSSVDTGNSSGGNGGRTPPHTNTYTGMLLYGINSCGKSSLAKAVGLNVILAQAGLFTAGRMVLAPYTKIITRLSGHDDLFKSQSSFVVELMELRTILRNSDAHTLVLGDEVARGTETFSATGLTVSMMQHLVKTQSSFILSSHLHHLPELPEVAALAGSSVRICHLSTEYDPVNETVSYDRKLKDGSGESIYGILVARSLGLDKDFVDMAEKVRKSVSKQGQQLLSTKKSRYNSQLYVDNCEMCGCKAELQTHHLEEQHTADKDGFIGNYHKNSTFNLMVLCSKCHTYIHNSLSKVIRTEVTQGSTLKVVPE